MSQAVMRQVRERSSLKGLDRAVLLAIAHYARDDGTGAYPSIATLARDTGSSDRGVQKAIKRAVNAGELKRLHNLGPYGVNRYEVRIDKLREKATRASTNKRDHPRTQFTPEHSSDKGSGLEESQYSSEAKIQNKQLRDSADAFAENAATNGYLTCSECGRYGGWCDCDSKLQTGFDRETRETLDAGKPGPSRLASEGALRQAYATQSASADEQHGSHVENAFPTHFHAFGGYV
jgi:hypothetical protein